MREGREKRENFLSSEVFFSDAYNDDRSPAARTVVRGPRSRRPFVLDPWRIPRASTVPHPSRLARAPLVDSVRPGPTRDSSLVQRRRPQPRHEGSSTRQHVASSTTTSNKDDDARVEVGRFSRRLDECDETRRPRPVLEPAHLTRTCQLRREGTHVEIRSLHKLCLSLLFVLFYR